MEVGDLEARVSESYVLLITMHIIALKRSFPGIDWRTTPIIIIPEENSYVSSVEELAVSIREFAKITDTNVLFYYRFNKNKDSFTIGKNIGIDKADIVYKIQRYIESECLGVGDTVFSLGDVTLSVLHERLRSGSEIWALDAGVFNKGSYVLKKLRDDMSLVTTSTTQSGITKVTTGGKRSQGGRYTRDDSFASLVVGIAGFSHINKDKNGLFSSSFFKIK